MDEHVFLILNLFRHNFFFSISSAITPWLFVTPSCMCLIDDKQYYQQKNAKWKLSSESIKQMCLALKKTLRHLRTHSFVIDLFIHF